MKVIDAYELKDNILKKIDYSEFNQGKFEGGLLEIFDDKITKIIGFGGCFTETSSYNYSLLSKDNKQKALEAIFGKSGLNYNLARICVGSSDFGLDEYCYVKENDYLLTSFSINRDKKYIIPFIKDAIEFTNGNIKFLASPWSPPAFMKTNGVRNKGGKLKKQYYDLYAEYLSKFLLAYKNEGIKIEYFTIQNEPKATQTWESCVFSIKDEKAFAEIFKRKLRKYNIKVKLLCWDHNKERLVERAKLLDKGKLFSGVAYHWYSGNYYDSVSLVRKKYPNKIILESEFCKSSYEDKTINNYVDEYINSIRCGSNGLIEWNLITDSKGGPFHFRNGGCLAPITYTNNGDYELSSNYLQSWLFSQFIQRNSLSLYTASFDEAIKVCCVKNPDNTVVINILNKSNDCNVKIYYKGKFLDLRILKNASYVLVIKK